MILMFNYITKSIIPIIVLIIITYGKIKGRKVYDWFVEGAKDGLKVCVNIFPYLLAMIIAVQIFREANLLDMLNNAIATTLQTNRFTKGGCTFSINQASFRKWSYGSFY